MKQENNNISFTLSDMMYDTDPAMLDRARTLVSGKKLQHVQSFDKGFSAIIRGTKEYQVNVARRAYDHGHCTCYMGQKDQLCKHMLALALYMLRENELVDAEMKKDLSEVSKSRTPKQLISAGCRKLQPYSGDSYAWFSYQNKLDMGIAMIRDGLSKLPHDKQTAKYLFALAQRINKKIAHGIDDSNGTVWPVIEEIMDQIIECAKVDPTIEADIRKWAAWDSGFGFEDTLKGYLK